jgi:hypothetical protein
MTTPAPNDFSFNVVPGTNTMVATWVLSGAAASASVVSAELIVNDVTINTSNPGNGYRSFLATPAQVTARAIQVDGLNGLSYSVRLFVTADGVRYMTSSKSVTPQSAPLAPEITCEGTTNSIVIRIENYTSELNETSGFSTILGYDVFYNNAYKSFSAAASLTLVQSDGVANGIDYEVAVRAKNANGVSPFSLTKVVRPSDRPTNVANFTAVAGDKHVVLTWGLPSSMTSDSEYRIQQRLGNGVYEPEIPLTKTIGTPASDRLTFTYSKLAADNSDLVNGSIYSYRIRVYNPTTLKFSEYSPVVHATPYGIPGVPNSVVDVSSNRIQITLSRPASVNGKNIVDYILNRIQGNGSEVPVTSTQSDASGNPIYVISADIVNGTQYSFNAYARNNASPESKSLPQLVLATPYGNPGPVRDISGVGLDQEVRLSWSRPASDGGYSELSYRVRYTYMSTAAVGNVPPVYTEVVETTNDLFKNLTVGLVNGTLTEFNVFAYFTQTREYTSVATPISCRPFRKAATIAASAVTVVMNSSDHISYSWAQPELYGLPFSKYRYKSMLSNNTQPQLVGWVDLAANSQIIMPTQYGQSHKFLLKTVTLNGSVEVESDETEVLYTPYRKPQPVRNLQVYAKNLSLDVVWDPPSDFGGYPSVRYNVTVDNLANFAPTSNEKVTIENLSDKTSYLISVVALGYLNNEPQKVSTIVSVSGAPHGTPEEPTDFEAVPNATSVELSWVAPIGYAETPVTYVIFKDGDRIVNNHPDTTYTDTNVLIGTSYKYKVMTKQDWSDNFVSYSDFTDEITATPFNNPNPVQGLNVLVSDSAMDITWNPLSTADKNGIIGTVYYDIRVTYLDASGSRIDAKYANQTGTSVYFDGLQNGREYRIDVKSEVYNSEISANVQSDVRQVTTTVNSKPAPPRDVVFTPSDGRITVEWFGSVSDAYTSSIRYEFQVNGGSAGNSTSDVKSGTKNSYIISLGNGTSNVVRIRRVAKLSGSATDYFSDWTTSDSLMPFKAPVTSAVINSSDRKKLDFTIEPSGSMITRIVALIVTDKYSSNDESFKQVTVSNTATSGTISESVSFNIAQGTSITSFLAIVVNANGLITVIPTPA